MAGNELDGVQTRPTVAFLCCSAIRPTEAPIKFIPLPNNGWNLDSGAETPFKPFNPIHQQAWVPAVRDLEADGSNPLEPMTARAPTSVNQVLGP